MKREILTKSEAVLLDDLLDDVDISSLLEFPESLLDISHDEIEGQILGNSIDYSKSDMFGEGLNNKSKSFNLVKHWSLCDPGDDFGGIDWLQTIANSSLSKKAPRRSYASDFGAKLNEKSGGIEEKSNGFKTSSSISASDNRSCFKRTSKMTIPGKQRTKRSRVLVSNWGSRQSFSNTVLEIGLNFSISANGSVYSHSEYSFSEQEESQPSRKITKTKDAVNRKDGDPIHMRTCMHCGIQKTPQWRSGPLGPKTLCNACGVRYKSGRLFPEYRPAASPTFLADKHSNSHKMVLEMRRQKELTEQRRQADHAHFESEVYSMTR